MEKKRKKKKKNKIRLRKPIPDWLQCRALCHLLGDLYLSKQTRLPGSYWSTIWHHPMMVYSTMGYIVLRALVMIFVLLTKLHGRHLLYLHYAGDASLALDLRTYFNVFLLSYVSTIGIYKFAHWKCSQSMTSPVVQNISMQNIPPIRLLVGLATPHEVGLRTRRAVASMLRLAHFLVYWNNAYRWYFILPPVSLGFGHTFYIQNLKLGIQSAWSKLVLSIHTVIHLNVIEYFQTSTFTHMLYLILICKYLKLKLKQVQRDLEENLQQNRLKQIDKTRRITKSFHEIILEVHNYNRYFWACIIFGIIYYFIVNASLLLCITLFSNIPWYIRFTPGIVFVAQTMVVCFLFESICRINYQGYQIYRAMHNYNARNYGIWNNRSSRFVYNSTLAFNAKFKMYELLIGFKPKKFAFTCISILPVNFHIFLEIILVTVIVFMKILRLQALFNQE